MFSVKLHRHPNGNVLAACDAELLGQTFREGKLRLEVSERFYGGETVGEDELVSYFSGAASMNFVGERTVEVAVREGLVDEDCVIVIGGVKHAQVLI